MEPLDPLLFGPDQCCFGCGPRNEHGMGLRFFRDGALVRTTFVAKPGWEGPPGIVHGGLQSTLADEVGAWTVVAATGHFGFTTSLQLRFLRPARTDQPIDATGEILERTETTARVRVNLSQGGQTLLTGTVSFAIPTIDQAERILDRPLPEAWRPLARPSEG